MEAARGPAWAETAIGLGLAGFAAMVLWQTGNIPVSPMYAKVGPRVFPYLVAGGLGVLSLAMLVQGMRGGWQDAEEKAVALDGRAALIMVVALLLNVVLIGPLGFTAASTVMFTLVAYGFGSRATLRDAALGFGFALLAYFGFAKALGVNIGAGVVERLLGG